VLKIGSPRVRFGWLAMAPGCFSGVAALVVMIPVALTVLRRSSPGQDAPWPIMVGDAFGFLSAASVWVMDRRRQRIMSWTAGRQGGFAWAVWGVHVFMFAVLVVALQYGQ